MARILSREQIGETLERLRSGRKVVFTNGCFDLLHVGHVKYLQQARALGGMLFLGLNSDASVQRLKGSSRPVQCQQDRAEILAELRSVDVISIFDEDTPLKLIEVVRPDVLVKGGDWAPDQIVGADFVKGLGGEVHSLQFVEGRSTSSIIEKVIHTT